MYRLISGVVRYQPVSYIISKGNEEQGTGYMKLSRKLYGDAWKDLRSHYVMNIVIAFLVGFLVKDGYHYTSDWMAREVTQVASHVQTEAATLFTHYESLPSRAIQNIRKAAGSLSGMRCLLISKAKLPPVRWISGSFRSGWTLWKQARPT